MYVTHLLLFRVNVKTLYGWLQLKIYVTITGVKLTTYPLVNAFSLDVASLALVERLNHGKRHRLLLITAGSVIYIIDDQLRLELNHLLGLRDLCALYRLALADDGRHRY